MLEAVFQDGGVKTLWHLLDRCPALIPLIVALLVEEV